jgi:hypothetical protein
MFYILYLDQIIVIIIGFMLLNHLLFINFIRVIKVIRFISFDNYH